jgi:aminoglycoside phosphotransferase (APT) family kinase protein
VDLLLPLDADQPEWRRLAHYLRAHLPAGGMDPAALSAEMDVAQFPGGHSNLTYLVRFGACEVVVRRPPDGPLPPKAHDIAREHRWLTALGPRLPLVPRTYFLCEDPTIIGHVFYVMERRRGRIIRHDEPLALASPEARRRTSEAIVDALAELHAVDVSGELASLGKPTGFVERQIRGWTERWHKAQTTLVPQLDTVAAWLLDHRPAEPTRAGIVHGDYKLDNVMLDDDDPGRVVAILDWEMAALGDPLVDLGILLAYWGPTSPPEPGKQESIFTTRQGWLTREAIVERYAGKSGRDVTQITFYEAFALFKIAIVIQQLFARYIRGETKDERYAAFDRRVAYLAMRAAGCISAR